MALPVNSQLNADGVRDIVLDTIVLTYDRARDHLDVGGKCNSLELMLDMLGRATRMTKARLSVQMAIELQQQLAQATRDAAISNAVRHGR